MISFTGKSEIKCFTITLPVYSSTVCTVVETLWHSQAYYVQLVMTSYVGWLAKRKVSKNKFRHADPGVCNENKA